MDSYILRSQQLERVKPHINTVNHTLKYMYFTFCTNPLSTLIGQTWWALTQWRWLWRCRCFWPFEFDLDYTFVGQIFSTNTTDRKWPIHFFIPVAESWRSLLCILSMARELLSCTFLNHFSMNLDIKLNRIQRPIFKLQVTALLFDT